MPRLDYAAVDKKGFGKIIDLLGHIAEGIDPQLLHLVYLRVSQINGCSYCVDLHYKDAVKAGIDGRSINGVSNWKHMPFFDAKTKAALHWAEAVTKLDGQEVAEDDFNAMLQYFSREETVAITHAIALMNGLNRLAIAFAQHPAA